MWGEDKNVVRMKVNSRIVAYIDNII